MRDTEDDAEKNDIVSCGALSDPPLQVVVNLLPTQMLRCSTLYSFCICLSILSTRRKIKSSSEKNPLLQAMERFFLFKDFKGFYSLVRHSCDESYSKH